MLVFADRQARYTSEACVCPVHAYMEDRSSKPCQGPVFPSSNHLPEGNSLSPSPAI